MYKILRIHNRLIIGGPSHNVSLLTAYLSPEFETKLLVGKKDSTEKDASYIAHELGLAPIEITEMRRSILPFNDIIAYFKIKKIIRQFKPDIVHTHASKSGAIGRMAAKSCDVPIIIHTFHGHVFHSYFSKFISSMVVKMETYLATKTDAIVAVSDSQRKELIEVYKIAPAEKVFTVPLGFNLDKFSLDQVNKRNIFRAKYGFAQSELVIGIIGRLVPIKNHEMFLEVAAIIKAQKEKNTNVRFVIIGDGESRPALKLKAAELNLSCSYYITKPKEQTDIVITSWETAIDQALAGLDIIVLTSNNEGTPVSLIEAQAALKPVVTTNVGGVEDIVIHGQTGFITAVGDTAAFAGYVQQLIDDPALRNSLGKNGYDNVIKRYSKQRLINDMKTLYHNLLRKKNMLK
jgi:glycosyltransferase involved in cell wall biosynthesis